jgi:hypothetical protein
MCLQPRVAGSNCGISQVFGCIHYIHHQEFSGASLNTTMGCPQIRCSVAVSASPSTNGNACDGLTSKHEGFNWCGLTEFLLVSSDPSPGENLKDSQRLEPQFAVVVALSLTGLTNLLVIDCLHSIVIDTCTCLQD